MSRAGLLACGMTAADYRRWCGESPRRTRRHNWTIILQSAKFSCSHHEFRYTSPWQQSKGKKPHNI